MPLNARRYLPETPLAHLRDPARRVDLLGAALAVAIDFSTARPTDAAMDEVHAVACGRYCSYPGGIAKDLELAEVTRYTAQGRKIFIYWEDVVGDALGGRAAGAAMARAARDLVIVRGGPPDGGVIYFCVDFDATPAQVTSSVIPWFQGVLTVLPLRQVGVYGGYRPVRAVLDAGLAAYACQTRAWSSVNGVLTWDPRACLQQYSWVTLSDGSQVDLLRVMNVDYGQWGGVGDVPVLDGTDVTNVAVGVWSRDVKDGTEVWPAWSTLRDARAGHAVTQLAIAALARQLTALAAAVGAQADDETRILAAVLDDKSTTLAALTARQAEQLAALNEIKAQLASVVAGDVDEAALAAALSPLLGADLAADLVARLAVK